MNKLIAKDNFALKKITEDLCFNQLCTWNVFYDDSFHKVQLLNKTRNSSL